jgi:hypothetical protein
MPRGIDEPFPMTLYGAVGLSLRQSPGPVILGDREIKGSVLVLKWRDVAQR